MRIRHLSDLHLSARPGPDDDGLDTAAALEGLLHNCGHLADIDLVVVSEISPATA